MFQLCLILVFWMTLRERNQEIAEEKWMAMLDSQMSMSQSKRKSQASMSEFTVTLSVLSFVLCQCPTICCYMFRCSHSSSLLPCLLCIPLSASHILSCFSHTHQPTSSTPSDFCTLYSLQQCVPLPFSSHSVPFESFLGYFLERLC